MHLFGAGEAGEVFIYTPLLPHEQHAQHIYIICCWLNATDNYIYTNVDEQEIRSN